MEKHREKTFFIGVEEGETQQQHVHACKCSSLVNETRLTAKISYRYQYKLCLVYEQVKVKTFLQNMNIGLSKM